MSRLIPFAARPVAVALLALSALAFAGCARDSADDPTATIHSAAAGRLLGVGPSDWIRPGFGRAVELTRFGRLPYPLAVGDRWDYAVHTRSTIISTTGPEPPS